MKKNLLPLFPALMLALNPLTSKATVFFSDTFASGSTLNSASPAAPTATSSSYQLFSSKGWSPSPSISSGNLKYGIATTTGGHIEVQALFSTNQIALVQTGDYIQMTVTFTNNAGLLTAACLMGVGLYNSGGVAPVAGGLNGTAVNSQSGNATGGAQNWQGYWAQLAYTGTSSRLLTRPAQSTGTDNRNQDLVTTGSSSQSYGNPTGTQIGANASGVTLTVGDTYTVVFQISLTGANTLAITNTLYSGPDTNGTVVSQFGGSASGSTYLTSGFDSLAIGWRVSANTTGGTVINISSIKIDGATTVISTPPTITSQPIPAATTTNGYAAFSVAANGFNMTYQWHRNGTNLIDGGNISGSHSDTLVVYPVTAADLFSGANAYYVTVTGAGNYSTNSTTNALSFRIATNLVWTGNSSVWDLNNTADWTDGSSTLPFNYGDNVTFDNSGVGNLSVNLSSKYLAAGTVTINSDSGYDYTFTGSGGLAGPAQLLYVGSSVLTLNNVNTHTGGTVISNNAAWLFLANLGGLGNGTTTLAAGKMEVTVAGSSSQGINSDLNVAGDFNLTLDGTGGYAAVLNGNISGTSGKTLAINTSSSATNRIRLYGANTVCDANITVNGAATSLAVYNGTVLAPYNSSGSQTYNGIISGNGGLIQRGNGTTVLKGANTYAGGTIPSTGTIGLGSDTVGSVVSGPIGTGPLYVVPELPNTTGSGQVFAYGGARTIANPIQYPSATNNQTLIIGGSNQLTFTGNITLQGLDNQGTYSNRIFQVTNTAPTIFAGVISDGGSVFGITKTGNGTLYLNAANTYTGITTNSAGVLAGSGSIAGSVLVQTNASISGGGAAGIGTLTINGNLAIAQGGGGFFRVNRSGSASDKVSVAGTLSSTGSGTITVTNLGLTLQSGDTFALFNKAVTGGSSLVVTGGLTAGLTWTNKLAVDGTVQVVQSVATNPTNLITSVSSGNLILSWPADHTGWTLQVQTNSLNTGLGTNWVNVPGSASVNSVTNPINSANGSVFYRLIYP